MVMGASGFQCVQSLLVRLIARKAPVPSIVDVELSYDVNLLVWAANSRRLAHGR